MTTPTEAACDATLWTMLGDELDVSALPIPGRIPSLEQCAREERSASALAARLGATVRPCRVFS